VIRVLALVVLLAPSAASVHAQTRYVDGVFVHAGTEPIALMVFADRIRNGQMRFSNGSLEDVPIVERVVRVLCSLPNWRPTTVWLSTTRVFRDEFAERRQLTFAVRPLNIYALEMRVNGVEKPEDVQRLLKAVGATADDPAILFITLDSNGVTRDYLVQIGSTER
jgi:hypothetical protein